MSNICTAQCNVRSGCTRLKGYWPVSPQFNTDLDVELFFLFYAYGFNFFSPSTSYSRLAIDGLCFSYISLSKSRVQRVNTMYIYTMYSTQQKYAGLSEYHHTVFTYIKYEGHIPWGKNSWWMIYTEKHIWGQSFCGVCNSNTHKDSKVLGVE